MTRSPRRTTAPSRNPRNRDALRDGLVLPSDTSSGTLPAIRLPASPRHRRPGAAPIPPPTRPQDRDHVTKRADRADPLQEAPLEHDLARDRGPDWQRLVDPHHRGADRAGAPRAGAGGPRRRALGRWRGGAAAAP